MKLRLVEERNRKESRLFYSFLLFGQMMMAEVEVEEQVALQLNQLEIRGIGCQYISKLVSSLVASLEG